MKKLLVLLSILLLTGCGGTTFLTKEKPIVIIPDSQMFICDTIEQYPDPSTLTDIEVARVIIALKTDLEVCKNKLQTLKTFLEEAKKRIEK